MSHAYNVNILNKADKIPKLWNDKSKHYLIKLDHKLCKNLIKHSDHLEYQNKSKWIYQEICFKVLKF